ncbi:MAG: hypothetical protein K6G61_06760 [Solobacterium sp.]|nr:hypothetical protein [Solobacterium sp.]
MQIFVMIGLFALGWFGGTLAIAQAMEGFKQKKTGTGVFYIIAIAAVCLLVVLLYREGTLPLLGGLLVAFMLVVDPFALTQAKADEIGAAARKKEEEEKKRKEAEDEERRKKEEELKKYKDAVEHESKRK